MKKLFLPLVLGAVYPAFSETVTVSEAQLIGRWQCITEYSDSTLTAITDDIITLHSDYRADDIGNIVMRLKDVTFRYRRDSSGRWKLEGNKLFYTWRDVPPTTPNHDPKIQKRIESDPDFRNIEQIIANSFQPQEEVIILVRIDSLGKGEMQQTQLNETNGEEMAKSTCRRL